MSIALWLGLLLSFNIVECSMSNNKDIVLQFQMDVSKKIRGEDIDVSQYLHDDVQWHLPQSLASLADGSDKIGIDQVSGLFDGTVAQFYQPQTMSFDFHSMIGEGDYVHMHFSLKALTSHGKPYANHYQTLFRLSDEKIAEVWEYFDSAVVKELFAES